MPPNTPTLEQRQAIREIGQSLPVTAGAGTGKTFVLTHRYFQILAEQRAGLDEILAITFTDKAANQMKEKIRALIRRHAREAPAAGFPPVQSPAMERPASEYWQGLMDTFDQAYISTIHGFCARLLRESAIEGGLDPEFTVMEEQSIALHQPEIIRRTVFRLIHAEAPSAGYVLRYFSPRQIIRRLTEMIQQRIQYQGLPEFYLRDDDAGPAAEDALYRKAAALFEAEAAPLLEAFGTHPLWDKIREDIRALTPRDESDLFYPHWVSLREKMERLDRQPEIMERANIWLALRDDLKKKGRKSNWEGADLTEVKQDLFDFREEVLSPGLSHLAIFREADEREAIRIARAWADLFRQTLEFYQTWKRQHNFLDYDDLLVEAVALLKNHPDIRLQYARQFKQILVDEFQDTNPLQYELIRLLAIEQEDGAHVCIVGDPKQSIYRFRGTEVSLFTRAKEQLHQAGVSLRSSFRSLPSLLAWFDACFKPLMGTGGESDEPLAPYEQEYISLQPDRSQPASDAPTVAVQLVEVNRRADDASMEARIQLEAAHIAEWLARELPAIQVEIDGTRRPATYGNVAILLRRTTYIKQYEYALQVAGLPYYTVAGKGFFRKPEIQDLMNILKAVSGPAESLAIVGALRSDLFGVSDEGLFWLAETGSSWQDILYRPEFPLPEMLSESDAFILGQARTFMAGWREAKDRIPPEDLLESICTQTGYLGILGIQQNGSQRIRNVEQFLNLASEFGYTTHTSLDAFITYIETLDEQSDIEEATLYYGDQDAVQLLTVHKAKGLEFPVVILPNIDYTGHHTLQRDFYPEYGLALAWNDPRKPMDEQEIRPFLYQYIRELESRQELAESKRLFYVASTRARDYLLLSAVLNGPDGMEKILPKIDRHKDNWLYWTLATLQDAGWAPGQDSAQIGGHSVRVMHYDHAGEPVLPGVTDIVRSSAAPEGEPPEATGRETLPVDEIRRRWTVPGVGQTLREINPSMLPVLVNKPEEFYARYVAHLPGITRQEEPAGDTGGTEYGTLVHRLLEQYVRTPEADWEAFLDGQLARSRFRGNPAVRAEIVSSMQVFLESPLCRDIRRYSSRPEVPFFTRVEDLPMNGQMDLVIDDEEQGMRVVDYKTDQVSDDEIREKVDYYTPQLCAYAFGILQSTGRLPTEVALYFWRTGQLVPVPIDTEDVQNVYRYAEQVKRMTDGT